MEKTTENVTIVFHWAKAQGIQLTKNNWETVLAMYITYHGKEVRQFKDLDPM